MILTFDADLARRLLEISRASTARRPNFTQLLEPTFWRDDMDADRRAKALYEIEKDGFPSGLKEADADPAKIPAGLWLVGDHGVYLMANVSVEEAKSMCEKHVAYAREVDPEALPVDTWYEAKRRSFGGDDGVEFLEAEMLESILAMGAPTLEIDMTADKMAVLRPEGRPEH